eukprot:CAMPEP_0174260846 /NCGR_PEP_ID=MMETSP0439-20130205/10730_1 /TAXON_ID=0 /ORGANISM="Stereomyxa ramosa, Strain Chinc5" /LENGTH=90 /DNA_ID=CAMNT_0015345191 /DNA_START=211 /DNA_END=483 /DNA_ORIENTATION=+
MCQDTGVWAAIRGSGVKSLNTIAYALGISDVEIPDFEEIDQRVEVLPEYIKKASERSKGVPVSDADLERGAKLSQVLKDKLKNNELKDEL